MEYFNVLKAAAAHTSGEASSKRYSLSVGPPKKDPKVKGVHSTAVQAFLKRKEEEIRLKELEDQKKKEALLAKRKELKHDKKARAMASRTKDNFYGYNGIPIEDKPKKRQRDDEMDELDEMNVGSNAPAEDEEYLTEEEMYEYSQSESEQEEIEEPPPPPPPSKKQKLNHVKKPPAPAMNFADLLRLAEKKQYEPVAIKVVKKNEERPRTAEELREIEFLERKNQKGEKSIDKHSKTNGQVVKVHKSSSDKHSSSKERQSEDKKPKSSSLSKNCPPEKVKTGHNGAIKHSDGSHKSEKPATSVSHSKISKVSSNGNSKPSSSKDHAAKQASSSSKRDVSIHGKQGSVRPGGSSLSSGKSMSNSGSSSVRPSTAAKQSGSTATSSTKPSGSSGPTRPSGGPTSSSRPPSSSSSSKAHGSSSSVRPSSSSGSVRPPGGSGSVRPSGGSGSVRPSGGSGSVRPSGGSGSVRPSGGSGSVRPSGGSGSVRPSGGSGSVRPSGDSGSVRPPGGSGSVRPPGGSGSVRPPGGSGSVRPPGGSGSVRPSGSSGSVRPPSGSGSSSVKPTSGSGMAKPPSSSGGSRPSSGGHSSSSSGSARPSSVSGSSRPASGPPSSVAKPKVPSGKEMGRPNCGLPLSSRPPANSGPGRPVNNSAAGPGSKPKCTVVSETISSKNLGPKSSGGPVNGMRPGHPNGIRPGLPPGQRPMARPPGNGLPPITSSYKRRIDDEEEYDSEMEDFIDDGGESQDEISKHIRAIFGYDRNRYKDESDYALRYMESSFREQQKEEARSLRLGIQEDLEEYKREQEELIRKEKLAKKMKKR